MKKPKSTQRPKFENTRKAQRKQKRQQKKLHRQEHYLKKKIVQPQLEYVPGKYVKRPADHAVEETVAKVCKIFIISKVNEERTFISM